LFGAGPVGAFAISLGGGEHRVGVTQPGLHAGQVLRQPGPHDGGGVFRVGFRGQRERVVGKLGGVVGRHQAMVPDAVVRHGVTARIAFAEVVPEMRGEQYSDVDEERDLALQRGGALDVERDAVALGVEIPEYRPAADKAGGCQVGFEEPGRTVATRSSRGDTMPPRRLLRPFTECAPEPATRAQNPTPARQRT